MTWSFWDAYCDEAYACLSELWAGKKPAPSGFDLAALKADLKEVAELATSSRAADVDVPGGRLDPVGRS